MSTEEPNSAPIADSATAPAPVSINAEQQQPSKPPSQQKKIARPARKSSPGRTIHKSAPPENKTFEIGDVVLGRLRGYPTWRELSSLYSSDYLSSYGPSFGRMLMVYSWAGVCHVVVTRCAFTDHRH